MKKIIFIFMLLLLTGCTQQKYNAYYTDVFDTFSTFTCYATSQEEFDTISNELHTYLKSLNEKLDIYNNYDGINNVKTINDNAGIKSVNVDKDIIDVLKISKDAYAMTDKTIDVSMGAVFEVWHNYREKANANASLSAIPTNDELKSANMYTGIDNIVIDEENSTVFIKNKGTKIDLGAVAKGFCCDKANEFLKKKNVKNCLLNLGGNVMCINDGSFKKGWGIGITDPDNEQGYIDKCTLSNQSAVTSGNYQRYYEYNGTKYHHIIDKTTLMPSNNNKSVTIICDNSTKGDIFSTALFILPYEQGVKLAEKNNLKVLWVTSTGEIKKNY